MVEVAQIQKVVQKDGGRVARSMKSWQNAAEQLGQSPAIRKGPLFFLGGGARVVQFRPFLRFNFSFRVFLCKYFYFGNFLTLPPPSTMLWPSPLILIHVTLDFRKTLRGCTHALVNPRKDCVTSQKIGTVTQRSLRSRTYAPLALP